MPTNRFLFAMRNLSRRFKEYLPSFILSIILVFFIASILLISKSLQTSLLFALEAEPDFVVQKVRGDEIVPIHKNIGEEIIEIPGTTQISPRVWSRYYFSKTKSVLLLGIDFLDEQSHKTLALLLKNLDLNKFFSRRDFMIVGEGVKKWMQETNKKDTLRFFTPKGKAVDLKLFGSLPKLTSLFSNDLVITHLKTAQKILGLKSREVTDFTFNVPNELEWEIIPIKIASLDYDLRVVSKKESKKAYEELFDYRSGFFLLSFLTVILAFVILIYQRYSQIFGSYKREIGILRATGWSVGDVLSIKFYENLVLIIFAYIFGVALAWIYIFGFGAKGFDNLFLLTSNFDISLYLTPQVDIFELVSIFLLFGFPYLVAILIPVWQIATTSPKEAML
jgi:ABC-type lipoprotein release transport system permease subunit